MTLALFDFDGTVTTHDSFREFLLFCFGAPTFFWRMLPMSPWMLAYLLKLISNQTAKQKVTQAFFKGMQRQEFDRQAERFVTERLNRMIRPAALEKLRWHISRQHRVILVSASFTEYLSFWCRQHGIELIATRLEEKDGILTGNFASANCWGPEKVRRIKEVVDLAACDKIYAYGDSRGDREMLDLAAEKGYRVF
ncbi:MAG: HAD-IB family hydrolase [Candidatus Riflebacteria bacterium HGW-Riflebacteria-2]|jgi:HAD superfamily hydrolase (TIGR01490 family)|nr:MAG: HAD-IB family hydrolase [Candidatus Riflebacteria bacterium HGW-Riflebacteria-2]